MAIESQYVLKTGDKAPDFSLNGIDGKTYSLSSFPKAKALLIIFTCNHCPYAKAKAQETVRLHKLFSSQGLQVIAINSNDPAAYPEDSFENMKLFAKQQGYGFPYLFDESQETAKAYGAACTPDPFLFDAPGKKLAYHGRLDDALSPDKKATKFEMEEAVKLVMQGKSVPWKQMPSMGCSIKWKR